MLPVSSPCLLGLDIRPHAVHLMQLRKTGKGYLVEQARSHSLPDEIFVDGKIRHWHLLSDVLADLVKELNLVNMATAIQLPFHLVRTQQMEVPRGMQDELIRLEIKLKLERDFPGLVESLAIDFIVRPSKDIGSSTVNFVVTRKDYMTQYVNCINASGLKVKIVDVDVYAMIRSFFPDFAKEVNAILYEKNGLVSCVIFSGFEILLYQQWKTASEQELLADLQNHLNKFSDMNIRKLTVYSSYAIRNIDGLDCMVEYADPFSSIILNPDLQKKINSDHLADYLVAASLARCELPEW